MTVVLETARRLLGRERSGPDPVKKHTAEVSAMLGASGIREVVRTGSGRVSVVSQIPRLGESRVASFEALVASDGATAAHVEITALDRETFLQLGKVGLDFQGRMLSESSDCRYLDPEEVVRQISNGLDVVEYLGQLSSTIRNRVSMMLRIEIDPPRGIKLRPIMRKQVRIEELFSDEHYLLPNGVHNYEAVRDAVQSFVPPTGLLATSD